MSTDLLEWGGTKIRYMVAGEGDPVLLIHGADIDDLVQWYCSEPRLVFNKIVVTRYCAVPDTTPRYDERSRSSCQWVRQFPESDRAATMPIEHSHSQKSSAGTCNLPTVRASNRRHENTVGALARAAPFTGMVGRSLRQKLRFIKA